MKGKKIIRRNIGEVIIYNVVFILFSSRFGLPLHNTPLSRIVNEEYWSIVLQPDILPGINCMCTPFI